MARLLPSLQPPPPLHPPPRPSRLPSVASEPLGFDSLTTSEQAEFAVYVDSDSDSDDDDDDDGGNWVDHDEPLDDDEKDFVAKLGNIEENELLGYDLVCGPHSAIH